MTQPVLYKYSVIQFPGSFDSSVHNSYVCIPNSWIINRDEKKVIVAVPSNEEVPVSMSCILNNGPPSSHWKTYAGTLKYETGKSKILFTFFKCSYQLYKILIVIDSLQLTDPSNLIPQEMMSPTIQ